MLLLLLLVAPCRYRTSVEEVPVGDYTLPLGQAAVVREGADITLVGWGAQVRACGAHMHDDWLRVRPLGYSRHKWVREQP